MTVQPPERDDQAQDHPDTRSSAGEPLVEVRELKTHYEDGGAFGGPPVKAVDGVSFDIHQGETLGLVGESGCGKTTLGRTLVRLERATAGEVYFDGEAVTSLDGSALREWRQRVAVVFQNPESSLNDRLTVGEIVKEPLDVHGWKGPADRRERVRDLLDRVGLQREHYYRYPHQFSGGQRQRVAIARALAPEPEFVVLDEPVSALDVSVQAKILNLLADLQADLGLTYLFIAHDLSVVRHISDRVAVMYLGNVAEIGPTEQVFDDPGHPYTYALLSAVPEMDLGGSDRITLRGTPPSPVDPPAGCPFSTRCPMKIQPTDRPELSREGWIAVQEFRSVVDERDGGLENRLRSLKARLGLRPEQEDAVTVVRRLLAERDVADPVVEDLVEAAELVDSGDHDGARALLAREFDSVCDTDDPAPTTHSAGHWSHCHRHDDDYRDVEGYFEEVFE